MRAIFGLVLLATCQGQAATYYWDGTSATWNDVANWSTAVGATTPDPGALPLVTDDLIFNITGANSAQNITLDAAQAAKSLTFNTTGASNFRGNISGTTARILTLGSGGITLAAGAGPVTIGESPLTYGAVNITMGAAQTWRNASTGLLSVTGNVANGGNLLTIGESGYNGSVSIGGVISGAGGITVTSKSRVVLSGANEFTGAITVNGFTDHGTIAFTSIANFGVASALGAALSGSIVLGNGSTSEGRLEYIGTTDSESDRTISIKGTSTTAGQVYNNGTGTLKFTATNFNTANGTGAHYLILGGSNTGSNIISSIIGNGVTSGTAVLSLNKTGSGTWILSGDNTYGGATTVSGTGKLVLSGANTPGASATSISGGGELVLDYSGIGKDNAKIGTGALSLGGGTVTLKGGSFAQTVASTSLGGAGTFITRTSGTSSLNLGAFTSITRGSSLSISADNVATTDRTNTNGILGGNFVVGGNWAINSTGTAGGAIVGLISYTPMVTSGAVSTTNYSLTGSLGLTANNTVNSLKIIADADGQTLDINTRNLLVTNIGNSAGVLFTANDDSYTYNITGTGFLRTALANQDTFFFVNNGTLNITADTGSGTGGVIKAGRGTLILGGDSSTGANWGGAMAVQQGTLRLTHNNGAGLTGGGISVQNLAALELGNSVAIGAEALTITGTGVSNAGALRNVASNTSSYAGAITIGVDGARINSDASGALTLTAGITTAVDKSVTFGGAGNTTVSTTAISGAGNLIKDGAGTLTLSFANTYTGTTTINAGTLALAVNNALPNGSAVSMDAATLQAGASTTNTIGTLDVTGAAIINLGTGATLVFADCSAVDWAEGTTLAITGGITGGASVRFGTSSSGLTQAQLSKISVAGLSNLSLDSNGYLQGSTLHGTLIQFF